MGGKSELNEVVVEYEEDPLARDSVLASGLLAVSCNYHSGLRRAVIVQEHSENVYVFNDKLGHVSTLVLKDLVDDSEFRSRSTGAKSKAQASSKRSLHKTVNDAIYISLERSLFIALCADDFTITVVRERSFADGKRTLFKVHNKIQHNLVHLRLCWGASSRVLCSIASNQAIYGWHLDKQTPVFQVTRHTDVITSFISVDASDMFITCSMDRRIVLWSAYNQRVKGIFEGHDGGVRCIHASPRLLVSGAFDCDARIWDLVSKECRAILRGHKHSVVAVRVMFEYALHEDDLRVFTADESGELRFWRASSRERFLLTPIISALQVFTMLTPQVPLNHIRFLFVVDSADMRGGFFGSLIACGSKLLTFVPKKTLKDFVAAAWCCYVDQISLLMTAIASSIVYYDLSNGMLLRIVKNIWTSDLTCHFFEGKRSRNLYIGCFDGTLLAYCFRSETIIDSINVCSKELTCIGVYRKSRTFLAVGCQDGSLRLVEETKGKLSVTPYIVSSAFGKNENSQNIAIAQLHLVEDFSAAVVLSSVNTWGLWSMFSISLSMVFEEDSPLSCCKIIGHNTYLGTVNGISKSQRLLTFAIATLFDVRVYTIDMFNNTLAVSFVLTHTIKTFHIQSLLILHFTEPSYTNYEFYDEKSDLNKYALVATTEEGFVAFWATGNLLVKSEAHYRRVKEDRSEMSYLDANSMEASAVLKMRPKRCSMTPHRRASQQISVVSSRLWKAHSDTITTATAMNSTGCVVTVSNDGFQRVWNLESTCLGECLLPNVSEELQKNKLKVYKASKWIYRGQSFAFSQQQSLVADSLVQICKERAASGFAESFRKAIVAPVDPKGTDERSNLKACLPMAVEALDTRGRVLAEILVDKEESSPNLRPFELDAAQPINLRSQLPDIDSFSKSPYASRPNTTASMMYQVAPPPSHRPKTAPVTAVKGSLWLPPSAVVPNHGVLPAFSEASIRTGQHSGLLDLESMRVLQNYTKAHPGVSAEENLLLRDPSVAAQVRVPSEGDCVPSELSFGNQRHLYQNANMILTKNNRRSKRLTQHLITMTRIEDEVKIAKNSRMLHVLKPSSSILEHGLLLRSNSKDENERLEEERSLQRIFESRCRLPQQLQGAEYQLDEAKARASLDALKKLTEKEIVVEIQRDYEILKSKTKHPLQLRKRGGEDNRTALEKKLQTAIMQRYNDRNLIRRMGTNSKRKKLTTRDLLPFYRLEDVEHFLDIFSMVDGDQNGALDINEWISIFTNLDSALPLHEIISMFDGVDTRMDGLLLLSDMIPMLFSKASKEQKRLITQYAESHIFSAFVYGKHLKIGDLQRLFECYDTGCTGFVPVPLIKERLQAMNFPVEIVSDIIDSFLGINNDEYLNLPEFIKLFRIYTQS